MAIDNLTFAMSVEEQRKKLINNLKELDIEIAADSSLGAAIDKVKNVNKENLEKNENEYLVRYYDIDGTILKDEYVKYGGTPNPPANPSYDKDYIRFIGWVDLPEVITEPTFALASYESDYTYYFVNVNNSTFTNRIVALSSATQNTSSDFSIDWGDGTVGTEYSHTYSEDGTYIIKITGTFTIKGSTYGIPVFSNWGGRKGLFKAYFNKSANLTYINFSAYEILNVVVFPTETSVTFGSDQGYMYNNYALATFYCKSCTSISNSTAFCNCRNLRKVASQVYVSGSSVLSGVSNLESIVVSETPVAGSAGLSNTYNLKYLKVIKGLHMAPSLSNRKIIINIVEGATGFQCGSFTTDNLVLPSSLKTLKLSNVLDLKELSIPEGVTTLYLSGMHSLEVVNTPETITSLSGFVDMPKLKSLKIPAKVTSLPSNCFTGMLYELKELTISPNVLLTISSEAFSKSHSELIIWVNDSVIEQYKTATNWSEHADKMRPLSEKPIE